MLNKIAKANYENLMLSELARVTVKDAIVQENLGRRTEVAIDIIFALQRVRTVACTVASPSKCMVDSLEKMEELANKVIKWIKENEAPSLAKEIVPVLQLAVDGSIIFHGNEEEVHSNFIGWIKPRESFTWEKWYQSCQISWTGAAL